jgi:lipoyl(octanoyl) transferase
LNSASEPVEKRDTICGIIDWGLEPYARVCAWQKELVAARKAGTVPDLLLLGEHPPVITLGRNARRANVRFPVEELARRGVELHETDRGGDVTYHGPGQLVGYPILDLAGHRKDVVWYVRSLEEVLIRVARDFGIEARRKKAPAGRRPFYTGVWVGSPDSGEEKLAAIGVHISRWVTSHGFAFNVTTDLSHFDFIVPCGILDKGVTSLETLLSSTPSPQAPAWGNPLALMAAVKAAVVKHFGEVFDRPMTAIAPEIWEVWLGTQQAAAS